MVEVGRKRYEMIARRCDSGGTYSSRAINVKETGGGRSKAAANGRSLVDSFLIFGRFHGGRVFDWIGNKRDRRAKQAAGGLGTRKALTTTTSPRTEVTYERNSWQAHPPERKSQSG